ncbi:MAG: tetratricopeptide repeat protein [Ignavibacteriales bacterium]|nr:tetratricopeptide repeat protein [Ignavibacteriales bacterium]
MSEMLGNYHFLVRNYSLAIKPLEKIIEGEPGEKKAKKKLIVCYTQTGQLEKALNLFYELIREDFDCIINTNPESEDCPCPHLTKDLECGLIERDDEYELDIELGILWLYCSKEKSAEYFCKAQKLNPADKRISSIIEILKPESKTQN